MLLLNNTHCSMIIKKKPTTTMNHFLRVIEERRVKLAIQVCLDPKD